MIVASGVVQRHLDEIEQRLDTLEQRVGSLEGLQSDRIGLREPLADLTYEVVEQQEA